MSFFTAPSGSLELYFFLIGATMIGFTGVFFLLRIPVHFQRPLVRLVVFLSGGFWVMYWLWPSASSTFVGTHKKENFVVLTSHFLQDTVPVVTTIGNVLGGLLIGLGVYSILRVHVGRILKKQNHWGFSVLLLSSMALMVFVGYWDWLSTLDNSQISQNMNLWTLPQYLQDLLFMGFLQQMDAAMFAIVGFFIFSAAYRAFRMRSVESTIMLLTAVFVLLSLMGVLDYVVDQWIDSLTKFNPNTFLNNFKLAEIANWLSATLERPGIRALEFGLEIGGLALALRVWLSLDPKGNGLL